MNFIKKHIINKLIANDWNYDCLNWFESLYNDISHYMTLDKWIIFGMYSWFAWFLYRGFKARKQWKKECADEGLDWIEYDKERIAWRIFFRSVGLKFLIRKKYRDLDE